MQSNPEHLALWGQFVGDSIGHYLLRTQSDQSAARWSEWQNLKALPFKRPVFSVYATQAKLLLQIYSARVYRDPEQLKQEVIGRFRKESSNTFLSRAIHNATPFDFCDIEIAVRLGPLSTQFSTHEKMLRWLLPIIRISSNNQIGTAGALLYGSLCWHLAQKKDVTTIFEALRNWDQYDAFESSTWWAYQQGFEIYTQYGEKEFLLFVSSILETPVLNTPSAQYALSVLPILLYQAIHEKEFNLGSMFSWGGDFELLLGMKGCISALKHHLPEWLQHHYQDQKTLQTFPLHQSANQNDQQLRLF